MKTKKTKHKEEVKERTHPDKHSKGQMDIKKRKHMKSKEQTKFKSLQKYSPKRSSSFPHKQSSNSGKIKDSKGLDKSNINNTDSDNSSNDDNAEIRIEDQNEIVKEDAAESAEEKTEEVTDLDDEMASMRKELMSMPFEDLQKLKEKIGLKAYRQAMFGADVGGKPTKRVFKRENKNRPMEMTSKKAVSRFKQVMPVKKKVNRDPRFDDLSGEFNEELFKKSYSFLDDIKQKEKLTLMKRCEKETDPEKKEQMEYLIKRMNQQERSVRDKDVMQKRKTERRKKERELVKDGKKPFFLKKSDQKTLDLAEKYKELKKSGKLEKYLERKRKKNASKERRSLPNRPT